MRGFKLRHFLTAACFWALSSAFGPVMAQSPSSDQIVDQGQSASAEGTGSPSRPDERAMSSWLSLPRFGPFHVFLLAIPIALIALLVGVQNRLIYPADFPPGSRRIVDTPDQYDMPYQAVDLTATDGIRLKAYLIKPENAKTAAERPMILFFHANAGNMGHRLPIARVMYQQLGCNVMMLSYRGYGLSEGYPHESGIRMDAQAALDYLLDHPVSRNAKIIVFGQSLGGAVAIDLVSRNSGNVAALMIENTFLSVPKLVPSVLPVLRHLTLLCHQIWPSYQSIQRIPQSLPILFLSSSKDELIPPAHMQELFALATPVKRDSGIDNDNSSPQSTASGSEIKKPVRWWRTFPAGTHNDAPLQAGYFEAIRMFLIQEIGMTN